jgi:hypothetical protein
MEDDLKKKMKMEDDLKKKIKMEDDLNFILNTKITKITSFLQKLRRPQKKRKRKTTLKNKIKIKTTSQKDDDE